MTPRRRTVAGGVAAAMLGSGVTAALLLGPGSTSASTPPTTEPAAESNADDDAVEYNLSIGLDANELLDALVDNGVITQEQADAIAEQLEESMPQPMPPIQISPRLPDEIFGIPIEPGFPGDFDFLRPGRILGGGFGVDLDTVADAIGIDEQELRERLWAGESIAEIAEDNGVDPQTVIDALVDAYRERITDLVQGDGSDAPDTTEDTEPTETTTSV